MLTNRIMSRTDGCHYVRELTMFLRGVHLMNSTVVIVVSSSHPEPRLRMCVPFVQNHDVCFECSPCRLSHIMLKTDGFVFCSRGVNLLRSNVLSVSLSAVPLKGSECVPPHYKSITVASNIARDLTFMSCLGQMSVQYVGRMSNC